MKTTFLILTLLTGALAAQIPFTYESATECVSAARLNGGYGMDDIVILDRATGMLRLGVWDGFDMTWDTAPSGVSNAGFMSVGHLSTWQFGPMSVAVGSAAWNRAEVFTPATNERFSLAGQNLPTAMVAFPIFYTDEFSRDGFIMASSDSSLTSTVLGAYENYGPPPGSTPFGIANSPSAKLTSGNRVQTSLGPAAVFMSDGTDLQVWRLLGSGRWDASLFRDDALFGLDPGARYIAGRFGNSGFQNFVTYVPGESSFQSVAEHGSVPSDLPTAGLSFDPPTNWPADFPLGSAYAIPSTLFTSDDWLLLISQDGSAAELLDFSPENGPSLRESFTAPPGSSFTAAIPQSEGNFIILNGTGGHSTGWQRAAYNGSTHVLSASRPLPGIRLSSAVATLFTYTAEPWVNPDATLFSLGRIGSWTTSAMAGSVGFLNDLGVPNGLGNPGSAYFFYYQGNFVLPSQIRADVSLATLGTALNSTRNRLFFSPPAGQYQQPTTTGGAPAPFKISIQSDDLTSLVIHFRINGGAWQTYSPDAVPPVVPSLTSSGSLEAFAQDMFYGGYSPVVQGNYLLGPLSALQTAAFVDANGDGIDDNWAKMFGVAAAGDDVDGDGRTALQEYLDGTDPNDASSHAGAAATPPVLVITSFDPVAHIATLRLNGTPGRLHNIEWSPSLAPGSWTPLGSEFTMPPAGFIEVEDSASSDPRRFYRASAW